MGIIRREWQIRDAWFAEGMRGIDDGPMKVDNRACCRLPSMAMRGSAPTLGADVYERLRDQILAGELLPGSRLRPSELRVQMGVSVSVVREALTRLSEQQLVVSEPNLGFAVTNLTKKALDDIVQVRVEVEGFALGLAVANGDVSWESGVVSAEHTLARTPIAAADGSVSANWNSAHAAFHHQLLAGCGNDSLLHLCDSLFRSCELYRRWSDPLLNERDVAEEHRELARASVSRDADRAVRLLREHIERTRSLALKNIAALTVDRSA